MAQLRKPLILGSGLSGQAFYEALTVLRLRNPQWGLDVPQFISRGTDLKSLISDVGPSVLCVANPHGLHAEALLQIANIPTAWVVCDKPAAINLKQVEDLARADQSVAVSHGYRMMWGVQELKRRLVEGEFGDLISIEGRYWQSSFATRALQTNPPPEKEWKNDRRLSGDHDVLMDLGTHYLDLLSFLMGNLPSQLSVEQSYINSPAPHRDSTIFIQGRWGRVRGFGSVTKAFHGAGNDLEISISGARQSGTWNNQRADEIKIGRGSETIFVQRQGRGISGHPPFHGLGWAEGYIGVLSEFFARKFENKMSFKAWDAYPTLSENRMVIEALLKSVQK